MERRDEKTQSRRPGRGDTGMRGSRRGRRRRYRRYRRYRRRFSRGRGAFARAESRWSRGGSRGGRVCVATRAVVPGARPGVCRARPSPGFVPPDGIRRVHRVAPPVARAAAATARAAAAGRGLSTGIAGRPTPWRGGRDRTKPRRRGIRIRARSLPRDGARARPGGAAADGGGGRASIGDARGRREGAHREGAHARCDVARPPPDPPPRRPSEGDRDVRPNANARVAAGVEMESTTGAGYSPARAPPHLAPGFGVPPLSIPPRKGT